LVKFGTFTLPRVQSITDSDKQIFVEKLLPDRSIAYRKSVGGYGRIFVVAGFMSGPNRESDRQTLASLKDGVVRVFDEETPGVPTVNCELIDRQFSKTVDKWGRIAYRATFAEISNP